MSDTAIAQGICCRDTAALRIGAHWLGRFSLAMLLLCVSACDTATIAGIPPHCDFGDIRFNSAFPAGRIDACAKTGADSFVLTLSPENTPINHSPWYSFKVDSDESRTISVSLSYAEHTHRYRPKLSNDGEHWEALDEQHIEISSDAKTATLSLQVGPPPLWVSAQEIIDNDNYSAWLEKLDQRPYLERSLLGHSAEGRAIDKLETSAAAQSRYIVLVGRQHPPEVTGALALMAFAERMFAEDELASNFRQQFGILMVPNLNPDGVHAGNWRHNMHGIDLNRDWGPFSQPETRLMRDQLSRFQQPDAPQLYLFLDFHSTTKNVFYTPLAQMVTFPAGFTSAWMNAVQTRARHDFAGHAVHWEPGHNPDKPTSKAYVYDTFGISAITVELGDETDRQFIKGFAAAAAEEMMKLLLATAATAPQENFSAVAPSLDTLIINGLVYDGTDTRPRRLAVGIRDKRIVFIGDHKKSNLSAKRTVDAAGALVVPGFIDPHTHSLGELRDAKLSQNLNYLTQGVTTVFTGNDGAGTPAVAALAEALEANGIGNNVAFFVGHGAVREAVMGRENRAPDPAELEQMKALVNQAMAEGALGLSTGLYYTPGSYSATEEIVALARVSARYGGIYDSHLRDESSYTIGFLPALQEALDIGRQAQLPVHIAHIKALGVDVWGQSEQAIAMIATARAEGLQVTADQYPWSASGTHLGNALVPRWAMADSYEKYQQRLRDPALLPQIKAAMRDNLRRRGGAKSLLMATSAQADHVGKTLAQIAEQESADPVDAALTILRQGKARVISFNMQAADISNFMSQAWVMTSSDGNDGHPRKYASYPKKFQRFVVEQELLSTEAFVHRSSGLVADTFGLVERGYLKAGFFADIAILDADAFQPRADYLHWNKLSAGVDYLFVNGVLTIDQGVPTEALPGRALRRQ